MFIPDNKNETKQNNLNKIQPYVVSHKDLWERIQ